MDFACIDPEDGEDKIYTRKFEFEIEVLVKSSWKGIPVDMFQSACSIPNQANGSRTSVLSRM